MLSKFAQTNFHLSEQMKIWHSIVISRTWAHGLTPIADLFNHHTKGALLAERGDNYVIENGDATVESGQQVYDNYGIRSVWHGYKYYGFIDYSMEPTCDEMRLLRMKTHVEERSECIANGIWTFKQAIEELNSAVRYEDFAMIKGIAKWMYLQYVV